MRRRTITFAAGLLTVAAGLRLARPAVLRAMDRHDQASEVVANLRLLSDDQKPAQPAPRRHREGWDPCGNGPLRRTA